MKLNRLLLTAIIAVSTCSAYAQVTIGRPVARAFSGKVLGDKNNPNKPNISNIGGTTTNQNNTVNSNSSTSTGSFSNDQLAKANTAKDATYLSQTEKDVIYYCNLARLDGQAFANQYLGKLKGSSNSYEKSLLTDLAGVKNLPMLKPNSRLAKAAKVHVDDIGPKGLTQHESSDGTATFTRVRSYYNGGYMGENISFGYSDAMDIVIQLLVDDGVESLGHRHNILNKGFCRIGVSVGSHKQYRSCCVQDFSDDRGDNAEEANGNNSNNNNNNVSNNNNNNQGNNNVTNNNHGGNNNNHGYHDNHGYHHNDHGGHRPNRDYDDDDDDYDDDDDEGGLGLFDFFSDIFDNYYDADEDEYYNDEGDYYDDDTYCDDDDYYFDDDDYDDDDDAYYYDYDD